MCPLIKLILLAKVACGLLALIHSWFSPCINKAFFNFFGSWGDVVADREIWSGTFSTPYDGYVSQKCVPYSKKDAMFLVGRHHGLLFFPIAGSASLVSSSQQLCQLVFHLTSGYFFVTAHICGWLPINTAVSFLWHNQASQSSLNGSSRIPF